MTTLQRYHTMELPCEIASREILPSIRAAIVRYLVEERGLSKYSVAKIMGLTPAAVTYYLKGKRGNPELEAKLLDEPRYREIIVKIADMILNAWREGFKQGVYSRYKKMVCVLCASFNPRAQEAGCPH